MNEGDKCVYVGPLSREVDTEDIRDFFEGVGKISKIDLKNGFGFVWMSEGWEESIKERNNTKLKGASVHVEQARGDGIVKRREDERRARAIGKPTETLFVVNFDQRRTAERDLEDLFGQFGEIIRIQIRKNYAFVQFLTVDEAKKAQKEMNGVRLGDRELSVEFSTSSSAGRDRDRPMRRRDDKPYRDKPYDSYGERRRPPPRDFGSRFVDHDRDRGRDFDRNREFRNRDRSRSRDRSPRRDRFAERDGFRERGRDNWDRERVRDRPGEWDRERERGDERGRERDFNADYRR